MNIKQIYKLDATREEISLLAFKIAKHITELVRDTGEESNTYDFIHDNLDVQVDYNVHYDCETEPSTGQDNESIHPIDIYISLFTLDGEEVEYKENISDEVEDLIRGGV